MGHDDEALYALDELALVLRIIEVMQIHQSESNVHQFAIFDILMHAHDGVVKCALGASQMIKVQVH